MIVDTELETFENQNNFKLEKLKEQKVNSFILINNRFINFNLY
jgi:hypothetical protein